MYSTAYDKINVMCKISRVIKLSHVTMNPILAHIACFVRIYIYLYNYIYRTRLEAGGQLRPNRRLLWETGGQLQWRLVDIVSGNFRSNDAARVACRQLGFSTYARYGTVERLG